MIIAASNPQGLINLTPQIKERFVWYTSKFDKKMWKDYMIKKYDITQDIGDKLSRLILDEEFLNGNNFCTPRSLDKAVNMILNGVDTPYHNQVKPILDTLITNPSDKAIKFKKKDILLPSESKSWLDIIKLKKSISDETIKK